MITQIYSPTTVEEARNLVKLGVDYIGVNVGIRKEWPTILTPEKANEILLGVTPPAKKMVLTVSYDLNDLQEIINRTKFDVIHLIAEPNLLTPEKVKELKKKNPPLLVMRTIPITDETSIQLAKQYEGIADFLLLDSRNKNSGSIGATGETHDWNISRKIVELVSVPAVLAGGLGPDNVAEAIAKVHPFGVDSKTKTNYIDRRGKDMEKVRQFVKIAHEAE